jgi:drug/metabolite transporter (DMT)-like permease
MLGTVGVLIFSLTLPMAKVALAGNAMSSWFVRSGRAVLAALAGSAYLLLTRVRLPPRESAWPLLGTTAGVVFGWPLLSTIALRSVPSGHAAVVNGFCRWPPRSLAPASIASACRADSGSVRWPER